MSVFDIPLITIDGRATTLGELSDGPVLVVNVASRCGLTPQYGKLEQLQRDYADRGLTVVGFPCNQFAGQEPGSAEKIQEFCSTSYGVTFPLMEKTKVNGRSRHPLYAELTTTPDGNGKAGRVSWNFEKFVVDRDGGVRRFRPKTQPDDPEVIAAIDAAVAVGHGTGTA
ncbi:glutathione peroxidase [Mycetocola reblochoni]|uniref:Glutathione peroxidase n=2 Tax=Mycetocola reblochoni TaxID=331618 RepID=A0A1R4JNQ3_9MICO|nr:glutathione peroxidase [Mycetocola reblochoni]RLP68600.1 glutathione peroxidase [Mycetocola reblochoni]SJN33423.1 Glutathione peroxidase family protein [Mycetocola reblochoni REB411]